MKENLIKILRSLISTISSMLLFLASVTACAEVNNTPSRVQFQRINHDGIERSFYLHLPRTYKSDTKWPLVLVLHGGGKGDGKAAAELFGFTSLADRYGFIVVYPNGIDARWNDGRGITYRGQSNPNINDVGFISRLVDHLIHAYNADAKRIYVTGLSNGGMMTLRLGCEIGSKFAAIAPVIANLPTNIIDSCHPDSALPVLVMNGTVDPLVPWNGGYVRFFRRKMGEVVSTEETVQHWIKHNQCNASPKIRRLPDKDTNDGSTVKVATCGNPVNGSEVVLYAIEGGGHTLPGSNIPDRPRILGRKNNDINGPDVIWKFFKKHSR